MRIMVEGWLGRRLGVKPAARGGAATLRVSRSIVFRYVLY